MIPFGNTIIALQTNNSPIIHVIVEAGAFYRSTNLSVVEMTIYTNQVQDNDSVAERWIFRIKA